MDKYQREQLFLRQHYDHVLSTCDKFTSSFAGVNAQPVVYYKDDTPPSTRELLNNWIETRLAKPAFYICSCVLGAYIALINSNPSRSIAADTSFKHGIVSADILLNVLKWMSRATELGEFPWKDVVDFALRVDGGKMYLEGDMVHMKFDVCLVVMDECLVYYHGGERCQYVVDGDNVLVGTR